MLYGWRTFYSGAIAVQRNSAIFESPLTLLFRAFGPLLIFPDDTSSELLSTPHPS